MSDDLAYERFKEASIFFQQSQFSKAIEEFSKAITFIPKPSPDNAFALEILVKSYFSRALCYYNSRNYKDAMTDFEQVQTLVEKFSPSLDPFEDQPALNVTLVKSLYMKAKTLHQNKDQEGALRTYSKAIELGTDYNSKIEGWIKDGKQDCPPHHPIHSYYMSRGLLYNERQEYDKAIGDFTKYIELVKHDTSEAAQLNLNLYMAYHNRGIAWENLDVEHALNDFTSAIQHFEQLKDLEDQLKHQKGIDTYYYRARLLEKQGKKAEALKDYNFVVKYNDLHPMAHYYRAHILYYEQQDYKEAKVSFSKVISNNPNEYSALFNRGMCSKFLGEPQKAIQDFKDTIKANDKYFKAYIELARLLNKSEKSQPKELIDLYTNAIDLLEGGNVSDEDKPDSDSSTAFIYFERGVQYNKMENYEKAVADFSKAIEFDSNFVDAYFNRALIYRRFLSQLDKSLADIERVIEMDPSDTSALLERGLCLYELDRLPDAKAQFEKVLALDSSNEAAKRFLEHIEGGQEE